MPSILDNFSTDNPVFSTYVFYTTVLIIKTLFMALLTVVHRVKNKAVASKEDSPKGIVLFSKDVERQRRAHLNDLENIPIFIIVAFLYTLTSPSTFIAVNLIRLFTLCRIVHTFVYAIYPTQPARGISFGIGILITFYMSFQVAIYFY
ncbi:microsomal glutathione S-transferase 1-like [Chironomus tepperi]|uniref:microsomal glutathione S-transferase 1-like n=1 Tax=Chironomus tepperi TaxID=113505 RepID=UPI00391F90AE